MGFRHLVDAPADVADPSPTDTGPVSVDPSSAAAVASLPATGTTPLGLLLAALVSALAGSLLLHREAQLRR